MVAIGGPESLLLLEDVEPRRQALETISEYYFNDEESGEEQLERELISDELFLPFNDTHDEAKYDRFIAALHDICVLPDHLFTMDGDVPTSLPAGMTRLQALKQNIEEEIPMYWKTVRFSEKMTKCGYVDSGR